MKFLRSCLLALVLPAMPAMAVPVLFSCLSNNSGLCPPLNNQMVIDATDAGSNRVSLELTNSGPILSSVTAVYFDFPSTLLTGFFSSTGTGTVDFPIDGTVSPPNLPGGLTAVPPFISDLGIDSDPPSAINGVGVGESLTLVVDIGGGFSFGDVLDALFSNDLRIGLHVQSIGPTGIASDSLLSIPPIPEPGTYVLLGGGLLTLIGLGRKKSRPRQR